jgi:hypothetical protein
MRIAKPMFCDVLIISVKGYFVQEQNNKLQAQAAQIQNQANSSENYLSKKESSFPFLKIGSTLIISGGITFLILHHLLISLGLFFLGILFFGANALVKKSLHLSSQAQLNQSPSSVSSRLELVKQQMIKTKYYEHLESEGTALVNQAEVLLHQYKTLIQLLEQKFNPGELTYSRYKESIDNTCMSISEFLLHLKNCLDQLNLGQKTKATSESTSTNWESQRQEFLLAINKSNDSIAQLTHLFQSLNSVITQEQHRGELDNYLLQLNELSDRAKLYSTDQKK